MGLSSSQARLLTLTSRQHAIEYKAQKLEAEKLQLANDSDQVYNTYLSRLDAKKIQYKNVESDGSIVYLDAKFSTLKDQKMLFRVGNCICTNYDQVKNAMHDEYGIDITANDSYTVLSSLVSEGYVVLMQEANDMPEGFSYDVPTRKFTFVDSEGNSHEIALTNDSGHGFDITDIGSGGQNVQHGAFRVSDYLYKYFQDTSVSTSTKIQEVSDEVDLKKAEAQYESDMSKINRKDTQYDTQLSQLETERKAIKEEIESLKNVAKDNVERTFKLFS